MNLQEEEKRLLEMRNQPYEAMKDKLLELTADTGLSSEVSRVSTPGDFIFSTQVPVNDKGDAAQYTYFQEDQLHQLWLTCYNS